MDYYFLGEDELVTAFRFAGVDGRAVAGAEDAAAAFDELTREPAAQASEGAAARRSEAACKILILSEQTADWLGETLTDWQLSGKYPLIVEVPPLAGHREGRKTLVDSIREAIGIHV